MFRQGAKRTRFAPPRAEKWTFCRNPPPRARAVWYTFGMKITLPMLFDLVRPALPDAEIPALRSVEIKGIRLAAPGEPQPPGYLYLRKKREAIELLSGEESADLVTSASFASVFNLFEDAYLRLRDWDMHLHQSIIEKESPQHLLDISEGIFQNPLCILDAGFKLVAYARDTRYADAIFLEMVEKGYMPAFALERFRTMGYLSGTSGVRRLDFRDDGKDTAVLIGTIMVNGAFHSTVVLVFNHMPYSEGMRELFSALLESMTLYFRKYRSESMRHATVSLLVDLMAGRCDRAAFLERNGVAKLPEAGAFRLLALRTNAAQKMVHYLQTRLAEAVPEELVFSEGDEIFVLLRRAGADADVGADVAAEGEGGGEASTAMGLLPPRLASFLEAYDLSCGVSDAFSDILELRRAGREAAAAIRIGERVSECRTLEALGIASRAYPARVFDFRAAFPYLPVEAAAAATDDDALGLLPRAFAALLQNDRLCHSDDLKVLYSYLKNDCRKTLTSAELFMHRNNLRYRLERIEKQIRAPLSDPDLKASFRIAFRALELIDPEAVRRRFA